MHRESKHTVLLFLVVLTLSVVISGCAQQATNKQANLEGSAIYEPIDQIGSVSGIGIETQDIVSITDSMFRDLLQSPQIMNRDTAPRVLIDSNGIENHSTSRIKTRQLADRLRVNLNRSAAGKLVFVSRENIKQITQERELKRQGIVDGGTLRATRATAGVDFRLFGDISSLDSVDPSTQQTSRYHQIVFEMIDMELGTVVWSELYEFKKSAQDNIIYR